MIRYERDLARRARYAGLNLRASRIQCSWRQRIARVKVADVRLKRLQAMEIAAARVRAIAERQRRRGAATRIQSSIRVYFARKELDLRRSAEQKRMETLKTQSAISIQSFFRMWMRRDHLNRLRSKRAQRQELMYQAQIRIRKSWRAYSLRNYICRETRRKKCDSAARKIQRSIRDRKRRLEPLLKREKMCPQRWIRRKISPTKIVYEHLLTRRKTRAKPKTFLKSGGRVRFMPQDTVSNIPVWTQFWSSKAAVSMFYIHRLGKFSRTKPKDVDTILHDGKKRFVKLWDTTTRSNYFMDIQTGNVTWNDPRIKVEENTDDERNESSIMSWTSTVQAKHVAQRFRTSLSNLGEEEDKEGGFEDMDEETKNEREEEEEEYVEYVDEESGTPYWYV